MSYFREDVDPDLHFSLSRKSNMTLEDYFKTYMPHMSRKRRDELLECVKGDDEFVGGAYEIVVPMPASYDRSTGKIGKGRP